MQIKDKVACRVSAYLWQGSVTCWNDTGEVYHGDVQHASGEFVHNMCWHVQHVCLPHITHLGQSPQPVTLRKLPCQKLSLPSQNFSLARDAFPRRRRRGTVSNCDDEFLTFEQLASGRCVTDTCTDAVQHGPKYNFALDAVKWEE